MEFEIGDRVKYFPYPGADPEFGVVRSRGVSQAFPDSGALLMVRWDDCGTVKAVAEDRVEPAEEFDESLTIASAMGRCLWCDRIHEGGLENCDE